MIMRDFKFREGDIVDFDMREDSRYDMRQTVQCEVLKASYLGFYDLMEINRTPKSLVKSHAVIILYQSVVYPFR